MHFDGLSVAGHDVTALQGTLLFHFLWRGAWFHWIPLESAPFWWFRTPKPMTFPLRTKMNQTCGILMLGPHFRIFSKHLWCLKSTMALSWQTQCLGIQTPKPSKVFKATLKLLRKHVGPQFFSPPKKCKRRRALDMWHGGVKCVFFGLVEGTFQRENPWKPSCLMGKPLRFRQQWVETGGRTQDLRQGLFHGGYFPLSKWDDPPSVVSCATNFRKITDASNTFQHCRYPLVN